MKRLRQYIRKMLLTEAMNNAQDLPDDIGISIRLSGANYYIINYYSGDKLLNSQSSGPIYGEVHVGEMYPYEPAYDYSPGDGKNLPEDTTNLTCDGAYQIYTTDAADGWGPLLYDVAIELASLKGTGLVSDRSSVSPEALDVWYFYMYDRSDVEKFQCDDHLNTLTPTLADNVDMNIPGRQDRIYDPNDLVNDPLSKRYAKAPTTIKMLKSLGKLRTLGFEL